MIIFYRYSDSKNNKGRPPYFTKDKCLRSFLLKFRPRNGIYETIENGDQNSDQNSQQKQQQDNVIYIIADNVCEDTYNYLVRLVGTNYVIRTALFNSKSFLFTIKMAIEMFDDDEKIYLVEDDYIHTNDASKIIEEGLDLAEYVSGYDHADKYINHEDGGPNPFIANGGEETMVMITKSRHWKITNSCCMTFATTIKIAKEDLHIYESYCQNDIPDDFGMFTELKHRGRRIISCIPAVSTHCETEWLSPFIDWEAELV